MKNAMSALRAHAKKPASEAHGKTVKLKRGGPTTDDMKQMGRNMARVMNQRGK